jgi:hypothetical protein
MTDDEMKVWCITTLEGAFLPYKAEAGQRTKLDLGLWIDFSEPIPIPRPDYPSVWELERTWMRVRLKSKILEVRSSLINSTLSDRLLGRRAACRRSGVERQRLPLVSSTRPSSRQGTLLLPLVGLAEP